MLSATNRNMVKLPYAEGAKHIVLTYGNESIISLSDAKSMYTLWYGPTFSSVLKIPTVGGLEYVNADGIKKEMSVGRFIGLCIHAKNQNVAEGGLVVDGSSGGISGDTVDRSVGDKRKRGSDELVRDIELVSGLFESLGFDFERFTPVAVGGDMSFVEEDGVLVSESPYYLREAHFKLWWTPLKSTKVENREVSLTFAHINQRVLTRALASSSFF